ncbi:hypothetical protein MTO96_051456 [Rhipicephalus appendiculatus]
MLEGHCGLDLWRNVGHTAQAVTDLNGTYSTYAYTDEAKRIIADHDRGKSALDVMDHSIGEVLGALQSRGMLADSIVVFASDNGAAPLDELGASNAGSNWPLRGSKSTAWEGGVRTPAVFWYGRLSSRLPRPPSQQMMHIIDWAPTLYAAAGGDVSALGEVDGRDQWEMLSAGKHSARKDMILQIEDLDQESAIISGRYKLVNRSETQTDPQLDSRVHRPEGEPPVELELDSLMKSSEAWKALQGSLPPISHYNEAVRDNFDPFDTTFVFDIISDPCELNNLASSEPELRDRLLKKLATFRTQIPIDPMTTEVDERGFPEHHQCTWSTWLDVEPAEYQSCPC